MRQASLVAVLAVLLVAGLVSCASAAEEGRVVLLMAGGVSARDVADPALPHLYSMFRSGSVGLVNVRSGRPNRFVEPTDGSGMESACVSLGAGAMAVAGSEARRAGNVADLVGDMTAGEAYRFRTGRDYGAAAIVHTEIALLDRANLSGSYRATPGLLGSALRSSGIRTAAIGNSDLPGEIHREAVAAAMDRRGLVDHGDVSSTSLTTRDAGSAYGVRANAAYLLDKFDRVAGRCRFVVIDFGDTSRADSYAEFCSDAQAARIKQEALCRLDGMVAAVAARLDFRRDTLIVLSPSAPTFTDLDEERLTPVLMRGPVFRGGLLTSPSTRRPGLVTICDIGATISRLFRVKPSTGITGRPIDSLPDAKSADSLLNLNFDASLQGQRQPAMRGASVAQSIVAVVVTLVLALGASARLRRLASWIALIPAILPMVMLCLPLIYSGGLAGAVAWLVLLTLAGLVACVVLLGSPARAFGWLCGVAVVSLLVDVARGAPLISSSIAGYSMVEGARYYGIGNELAGTLLGAALAGVGVALSSGWMGARYRGLVAAVVLGTVFVFMGSSGLGANAGGAASAAPAIAVLLLARRGWRPGIKGIVAVMAICALVVLGMFAVDMLRGGGSQSHIGRAVGMAATGGAPGLFDIAQRKLALNFMLLSTSVWSRLLGLSIVASAVLYWLGTCRFGAKLLDREQAAAATAIVVGTVFAFFLNDSGVLAAAASSVFLWMLMATSIYRRSHEK